MYTRIFIFSQSSLCHFGRSHWFMSRGILHAICTNIHVFAFVSWNITNSMLSPNSKPTQIRVRCSGTDKCSQRYQIGPFCLCLFSGIQPSDIPLEIPPELRLLEFNTSRNTYRSWGKHKWYEVAVLNSSWVKRDSVTHSRPMRNPTPPTSLSSFCLVL